jgi:vitamin B12 transporter
MTRRHPPSRAGAVGISFAVTCHVRREVFIVQPSPVIAASRGMRHVGRIAPPVLAPLIAVSILALAHLAPASADGIEGAPPAVGLPPVVVTATRIATPVDQVGSSVTLITADDIRRHQWRTLPDVLQGVPGLNVVQTGGPGGKTAIFMRGTNSNHTKVLIDGVEANDPSQDGAFDLGHVLTSDIERVEVLRGPQSSLYGSDAIGGVIDIVTKKGSGAARLSGSLEGGSFDTFNQTAGVGGSTARFNYAFNAAHFRSGDTPVTPLDLLPPDRRRIGDSYENTTISTKLGADVTDTFGLDLVVRYTDASLRFTGDDFSVFPSVPAAAQTDREARQLFTRGEARLSLFDGAFQNRFGIGYSDQRTRIQAPDTEFGPSAPTFNRGDRRRLDWQGTLALTPSQTLVLGLEDRTDRLIDSPMSARNGNRAGFAELQSKLADDLFVAASVRYDDNERFGGKATWRVTPSYLVPAIGTQLKGSYGTGFKAPGLTQLFVSFPEFNFFANPDLRPEESEGYDFGFEQPVVGDRMRFGATYFHNDIKNLINANAAGTSLVNVGRATTYGAETFVSFAATDRLKLRGDYTYTIARDDTTGQELLRRPKHRASLGAAWLPADRFSLSATTLYVGSWVDGNRSFSVQRLDASPYFLVNFAARYDLGGGVALFGRIDNLLDRRYEDPVGFQRPGLGVFAGIRVSFGGTDQARDGEPDRAP